MDLRPYQEEAIGAVRKTFADGHRNAMIVLPTGCHEAGQRVLTANGSSMLVESVRVGDLLMGPDGTPRTVLSLVRGEDDLVEIRPTKGKPWRVNREHILSLVQTRTDATPVYPSENLAGRVTDVSVSEWSTWTRWRKHIHKLFRVGVDFAPLAKPLTIDPYHLGLLLGDGTMCRSVGITSVDHEVVDEVYALAKMWGLRVRPSKDETRATTYYLASDDRQNGLIRELSALELRDCRSGEKFVPYQYKVASRKDRLSLLAGLMDTDGSLVAPGCGYDFISKSWALANNVAFIARSLGMAAYVAAAEKWAQTHMGGTYWRVSITGDVGQIPCRILRKQAGPRRQKKDVLRTGFTVAPAGRDEYFGFVLDGDRRYLLDDFTVTHNCGKTLTASSIVSRSVRNGKRVLWIAHRKELLTQPMRTMRAVDADIGKLAGLVKAESDECDRQLVYGSLDTMRGDHRMERYLAHGRPDLIIYDEAHHSVSASALKIRQALDPDGDRYWIGLTATPERTDRKDLGAIWTIAYHYSLTRAMEEGYLVPVACEIERLPDLDLSTLSGGRDFDDEELGEALMLAGVVDHTVSALRKHGPNRNSLVFCATVEQAKATAAALQQDGKLARWVSGTTADADRDRLLKAFADGAIDTLCNVGVLTEGTDLPRANCVVVARPTRSKPLYIQVIGRGLRLFPGKEDCLIIDIAGASEEHDLIQAPVLLGEIERMDAKTRELEPGVRAKWSALNGLGSKVQRRPLQAAWIPIRGLDRDAWAVECGEAGTVYVVRADDGDWMPYWCAKNKRKPTPLADVSVDLELAYGLGNDVVRRARKLNDPKADWRSRAPSDSQRSWASQRGVAIGPDDTRGSIADRMTQHYSLKNLVSLKLAKFAGQANEQPTVESPY